MDFSGVYQEKGSSLWSFRLKFDLPNGKVYDSKRKNKYKTKTEASTARTALKNEILKNYNKKQSKKRFKEIFDDFFNFYSVDNGYSSVEHLKSIKKKIFPVFGSFFVDSITFQDLKNFLYDLARHDYSKSYIDSFYNFFNQFFSYCVSSGYIQFSPVSPAIRPNIKENRKDLEVLNNSDFIKICDLLKNTPHLTPFLISYYCGLRSGEVYALRFSDLDFETNTITVNKQMQLQDSKWCFVSTKYDSNRIIEMPASLSDYLNSLNSISFDNQIKDKINNKDLIVTDFICVDSNGKALTTRQSREIKEIIEKSNIDLSISSFHFHLLRHTCCSNLAALNVPLAVLSSYMGHSSPRTTMQYYTHITEEGSLYLSKVLSSI